MIMMHSFTSGEFEKNLEKVFSKNKDGEYSMCFSATLSIKTSRQIKVEGCIGHVSSANIKGANVSDTVEGIGGTNTWKINSLSTNSTFAFFFEVVANNTNQNVPEMQNNYGIVQFITNYLTCSGIRKTRVTTICRFVTDITSNMNHISASFDEETATCLIARKAALQCSTEDSSLVLRWIDRTLIRLCQKFADFQGNNTNSFTLPVQFSLYPQFMFHLRRSNFIQVFNYSPDETSYYRHMLFTESPKNMLIMIQPCLYSYSFNGPPQPVPLDAASIKTDTIILMDTFFQVVIYHGEVIDRWRKNGYQDRPEYSNVKFLLNAPQMDAQDLINGRFPLPHFVDTEADGSQARFLLCRVNPSKGKQGDGVNVLTDDVSFQVFMNHLRRLSVEA
ncbi:hypothetical protein A3Q56_07396 [Intoshia linei]|uniref:Protein transport protein SEC23 n=1 Tax=Intoshia linei TaxID=1819745 RepID=A0A177AUJ7_9BILA|nr:hypothetical protein A3Q56_07396 [Intoshia linei]